MKKLSKSAKIQLSKSAKIRKYLTEHPTATPAAVAQKLNTTLGNVYVQRSVLRKQEKPKVVKLTASQVKLGAKMGITPLEYAEALVKMDEVKVPKKDMKLAYAATSNTSIKEALDPRMPIFKLADPINQPTHYTHGGIEVIDFIEAKSLGYHLGNVVKYISRAGLKGTDKGREDLLKAQWYLNRAIEQNEPLKATR